MKKEEKKEITKENSPKEKSSGKYFYAVGRRKTSVAQVRVYAEDKKIETDFIINGRKLKKYFPPLTLQNILLSPLKSTGLQGKLKISVLVKGGGVNSQAEAIRLGISRALILLDENFKSILRTEGLLTRDSRVVERKKPGLKKARRAPQWAKR